MEIRRGTQTIKKGASKAIAEFVFDNYVIYVFHGSLTQYDILIKYRRGNKRIRTPKHIHWVVDVLMKMQGNEKLAKSYLGAIQKCWNSCRPLINNDYETLRKIVLDSLKKIKLGRYAPLNKFGEYQVDFLYVLMQLLAIQEKTNYPGAYMFGNIISELLEADRDIFKIMSTAGFGGRR